ncbi:MAG: beta-glucosidase BglX [Clostridia bacterium]|nr:beta-glucosidase BglX [Clostridia bacterium]
MKDLEKLLKQMTLDEKVGQLMQLPSGFFSTDTELTGPAQKWGLTSEQLSTVGSCIGGKGVKLLREIQDDHLKNDRNKIPLLFMRDVIHGHRTMYPIILALTGSFDPEVMKECCEMAAREASADGVHLTFAPMIDVSRDARWGRVMEGCGEDTYLASVMGAAQVEAYQGEDISSPDRLAACVKHFAGYGAPEGGRDYNMADISERALRQFYLPSYKACIDAGVKMLMPSFNSVNGIPSTANSFLMQKILRGEWNYKETVISDWGAISELCVHGVAKDLKEAALLAFKNGCHIEMCTPAYYTHLAELVREGTISEAELDEAVLRVLRLKDELGLFEDPYHGASEEKIEAMSLSPEHRDIARRAVEESAVLLKNDGILPFSADTKNIAIIGPFAESKQIVGMWPCLGLAEESVSIYEGVRALLPNANITTADGCGNMVTDTDKSGFAKAVEVAKAADAVILCVGEHEIYSGESSCRTDIRLPGVQAELVKAVTEANPNTAIVLFNGRPLDLTDIYDSAPAILDVWFPGTEGGSAVANLVFGKVNPSGKLPMSFPKSVGQCPLYYNRTNTGRPKTVHDDEFQLCATGYRDCGNLPLFFFGEGLSYTKFEYENMRISKKEINSDESLTVTVTIKNSGNRRGKEVVQLYMRDMVASVSRPIQELVAFKKVTLEAGESCEISFEINEPMLRFWSYDNRYISEPGDFTLFFGYADHPYCTGEFKLV